MCFFAREMDRLLQMNATPDSQLTAVSISGSIERLTRQPGKKFGAKVVTAAHTIEVALTRS
jgi:hypothetical protein